MSGAEVHLPRGFLRPASLVLTRLPVADETARRFEPWDERAERGLADPAGLVSAASFFGFADETGATSMPKTSDNSLSSRVRRSVFLALLTTVLCNTPRPVSMIE